MPNTPIYSFPYPSNTDLIRDAHSDMSSLATAVENTYNYVNGLVPITPTGVHTGITFNANGVGTPTVGQTAFTIGGCFSTSYDVYRITWMGGSATASSTITVSYPGGAANSYYGNLLFNRPNASTPASVNNNGSASHTWIGWSGATQMVDMEIYQPSPSSMSTSPNAYIYARYFEFSNVAGAAVGTYIGWHSDFAARTSITLTLSSGVIVTPGTVRIYAYNT